MKPADPATPQHFGELFIRQRITSPVSTRPYSMIACAAEPLRWLARPDDNAGREQR
jgi:hypothetical protein